MAIDEKKVQELLAEGKTQYKIAQMMEISHTTVWKIARGEYRTPKKVIERCKGCGAKVAMPCLACQLNGS